MGGKQLIDLSERKKLATSVRRSPKQLLKAVEEGSSAIGEAQKR